MYTVIFRSRFVLVFESLNVDSLNTRPVLEFEYESGYGDGAGPGPRGLDGATELPVLK
jgi:hypothetical protein